MTSHRTSHKLLVRSLTLPLFLGVVHGDAQQRYLYTKQCRMLLSKEHNPPIQQVIDTGVMAVLVQYLACDDQPQLQFEAAWTLTNIASGTSEQTYAVVQQGALPHFVKLLGSQNDEVREQACWALGNIAGDGGQLRDLCLQYGVLAPLLQILQPHAAKLSLCRNATWTVSNLCRGKNPQPNFDSVRHAIPTLATLVRAQDDEIVTDAVWALSYLTDGPNENIQVVVDSGVVGRLVELTRHHSSTIITPALRAIGNIVTGTDSQTQAALEAGLLGGMNRMLTHSKETVRKEACWTLSNITAGNERQIQQVLEANIMAPLLLCLAQGDYRTRKEATWAVCNLASGGSPSQIQFLVSQGVLKPLCDLLYVQDARLVEVTLDTIANILKADTDGSNSYADAIEEYGGMEKIEALQNHENNDVYKKANHIITTYYSEEEDDEQVETAYKGNAFGFQHAMPAQVGGFQF